MAEIPSLTQRELELLRMLAQGEKEIEAGKGFELNAVLTAADGLLREKQC